MYQKRGDKGLIVRAKKERIRKRNIAGYLVKYIASPRIALSRIVCDRIKGDLLVSGTSY